MNAITTKHPKLSKAKARLLMDHPFFATLLIRSEIQVTREHNGSPIDTAATDGDNIFFNPDFLDQLTVDDTMFVLCHEVGHDSLLHSIRLGARNPEDWNGAADHAINLMLLDQGMKMPSKVPGLADPKYKGLSADRIYDQLRREKKPGGGSGKPGKPGKGGSQPGNMLGGDVLPNKASTPEEAAKVEQRAKQRVASAANMARMAGKLTGELARMVDDCLETKVLWTDVLRDYMTKVVKARDNWTRRNRRFDKFYLPTRLSKQMGPIVFIPDTSGSMFHGDDLEKICSEMAHCADQTQPEHILVVWADAAVKGEQRFAPQDFSYAALEPKGGGGTDMRVPLKHVEQYDPQVVVLCTDGYTPWPDVAPPYPVIIVNTTRTKCPDWAEVIEI